MPVCLHWCLKEQFDVFGRYAFSLSCQELNEKVDATLMSVRYLWSSSEQLSLALRVDWKQGEIASLALSKGINVGCPVPMQGY